MEILFWLCVVTSWLSMGVIGAKLIMDDWWDEFGQIDRGTVLFASSTIPLGFIGMVVGLSFMFAKILSRTKNTTIGDRVATWIMNKYKESK